MPQEREGCYLETFTGRKFYVLDPRPEDFCIEDIAHALSLQCRYNGHCKTFYSIAEHSVLLAEYTESMSGKTPDDQMRVLLHDAAEAYTGDIPTPIKKSIPALEDAEAKIEAVLFPVFGLSIEKPHWLKSIDTSIVVDEREKLMNDSGNVWVIDDRAPLGVNPKGWSWEEAKTRFLRTYRRIQSQR